MCDVSTPTRWVPVTVDESEKRGFQTGRPVLTDLWSYVQIAVNNGKHVCYSDLEMSQDFLQGMCTFLLRLPREFSQLALRSRCSGNMPTVSSYAESTGRAGLDEFVHVDICIRRV